MKKLIFSLSFLSILSCNNKTDDNFALISGKILNTDSKEITILSADRKINLKLAINNLGQFSDTLRIEPQILSFYDGKNYDTFYLEPGSLININYDSKDFNNSLNYTGKGSEASNYLKLKNTRKQNLMGNRTDFFSLNESAFIEKNKEIKTAMLTLLDSFNNISEIFKEMDKKELHYEYLNNLNSYERSHRYYTKNPNFKVSEGFLSELNELDYTNEKDYTASPNYKSLVENHYRKKSYELMKNDSLDRDIAYLKVIGDIPNQKIKNALLFNHAIFGIKYVKDVENYYTIFKSNSTNQENNDKIGEIYNNLKRLAKGSPSPEFHGYENYDGSTTSLSDLKGKYVYIDVWATWCGPCKAEIPHLKKVESQYHNKNIHFVSISVDKLSDKNKWTKMIEERELTGIQLLADNDFNSDFVKDYMINGIPQFILLDPNGNIVDRNAPRPSNPELINLFNSCNI
ncbi:TlpA family protein disulfide reductase [Aestuariivivens marinum]|uniref:TlpA family protein disulfide reductase n=1 Tax=Aestuariivivens marinum TaxID=2913555 RepID=UPI001F574C71|nr:TlpA disulfide reductase family protein [Aestuariivivens marinum]